MTLEYVLTINAVLLGRLLFINSEKPSDLNRILVASIVPIAVLFLYDLSLWWLFLAVLANALPNLFLWLTENYWIKRASAGARIITLLVVGVLFAFLHAEQVSPQINASLIQGIASAEGYNLFVEVAQRIDFMTLLFHLFGLLLVTFEANLLIRLFIHKLKLAPMKDKQNMTDQDELRAGRYIGVLERIIIFAVILQNQWAAIAFILAAKAFARFKELDNREFAEYVLIGTLLSVTVGLGISLTIRFFLTLAA